MVSFLLTHPFLQHTSSSATLPASPSSPVAPWDSLWEGREPAKLTFGLSDRLWYWMLTCLRPPSSFFPFLFIPPSPPPFPYQKLPRSVTLASPCSRKPRASSSNDTELQLNQERRANRWQGEKQLKGCGRRGGEEVDRRCKRGENSGLSVREEGCRGRKRERRGWKKWCRRITSHISKKSFFKLNSLVTKWDSVFKEKKKRRTKMTPT